MKRRPLLAGWQEVRSRPAPRQKALGRLALRLQRLDSTITAWVERHCAYAIFGSAGVRKQLWWIPIGDFRAQYSNEPAKGMLIPDPVEVAGTSVGAEPEISIGIAGEDLRDGRTIDRKPHGVAGNAEPETHRGDERRRVVQLQGRLERARVRWVGHDRRRIAAGQEGIWEAAARGRAVLGGRTIGRDGDRVIARLDIKRRVERFQNHRHEPTVARGSPGGALCCGREAILCAAERDRAR